MQVSFAAKIYICKFRLWQKSILFKTVQAAQKALEGKTFESLLVVEYVVNPYRSLGPVTMLNLSGYRVIRALPGMRRLMSLQEREQLHLSIGSEPFCGLPRSAKGES